MEIHGTTFPLSKVRIRGPHDEVVMMVNVQDDDTVQPLVLEHVARAFCAVRPA